MKLIKCADHFSDLSTQTLMSSAPQENSQAPNKKHEDFQNLCDEVSDLLSKGEVVGWFQGRAEWGLGH